MIDGAVAAIQSLAVRFQDVGPVCSRIEVIARPIAFRDTLACLARMIPLFLAVLSPRIKAAGGIE